MLRTLTTNYANAELASQVKLRFLMAHTTTPMAGMTRKVSIKSNARGKSPPCAPKEDNASLADTHLRVWHVYVPRK